MEFTFYHAIYSKSIVLSLKHVEWSLIILNSDIPCTCLQNFVNVSPLPTISPLITFHKHDGCRPVSVVVFWQLLFESCHSGCLFFWLNCLLLVTRWAIKGPWASSYFYSNDDPGQGTQKTEPILGTAILGKKNQLQPVEWESLAYCCSTVRYRLIMRSLCPFTQ